MLIIVGSEISPCWKLLICLFFNCSFTRETIQVTIFVLFSKIFHINFVFCVQLILKLFTDGFINYTQSFNHFVHVTQP